MALVVVSKDGPEDEGIKPGTPGPTLWGGQLVIEVASLAEIQKKVEGMELLIPYRETFYGSKELWLQEPGGNIIGFAEMQ